LARHRLLTCIRPHDAAFHMPRARMVFAGRVQIKATCSITLCCTLVLPIPSHNCCAKLLPALFRSDVLVTYSGLMPPLPETGERHRGPSGPKRYAPSTARQSITHAMCRERCLGSEPQLATGRMLSWHKTRPGRKISSLAESLGWRRKARYGRGDQRTNARHRHQSSSHAVLLGTTCDLDVERPDLCLQPCQRRDQDLECGDSIGGQIAFPHFRRLLSASTH